MVRTVQAKRVLARYPSGSGDLSSGGVVIHVMRSVGVYLLSLVQNLVDLGVLFVGEVQILQTSQVFFYLFDRAGPYEYAGDLRNAKHPRQWPSARATVRAGLQLH